MSRAINIVIGFIIERLLGVENRSIIELPMLMLRKFTQLFVISIAFLFAGIIGMDFLLTEIYQQLLLQSRVIISASLVFSAGIILLAAIGCLFSLRSKYWRTPEDVKIKSSSVTASPQFNDIMSAVSLLIKDIVEERAQERHQQEMRDKQWAARQSNYESSSEMDNRFQKQERAM